LLFEELHEGQVECEESVASEAHYHATSARSYTSGVSSVAASRDTPPLSSRYEEDLRDPNIITNDLDEAQSRPLSTEPSSQRSNRPVARSLTLPSRRNYGLHPLDPAETARRAALQLLDTYVCGPAAATADQQVRRHTLRERFLTQQVTTPRECRERLQQQIHGQPAHAMRTVPVVTRPGEATTAYEAQFQNGVERDRRLPSCDALRASFSETDIRVERRLRLEFAKLKVKRQLPRPRPQYMRMPRLLLPLRAPLLMFTSRLLQPLVRA
ncbi:hypothetical protein JG687_00019299, partial [Phytophthora cactorum]